MVSEIDQLSPPPGNVSGLRCCRLVLVLDCVSVRVVCSSKNCERLRAV